MQLDDLLQLRYGKNRSAGRYFRQSASLARILGRRTHRDYLDRPVEQDLIDDLLNVAFCASSKSDYQQASVIIVHDAKLRRRIGELCPEMPWIENAPAFLIFCADANRLEQVCSWHGRPKENADLEAFFNASVDAALVAQTFILAAEQVGLGCCPISAIRKHLPCIAEMLSLPKRVIPVMGICVGYPSSAGRISLRLPPGASRHLDRYDISNLRREIAVYDEWREGRSPTPRDNQRSVERFGYAEQYGWSEDKSRHAQENEGHDFGAMVRALGFSLD